MFANGSPQRRTRGGFNNERIVTVVQSATSYFGRALLFLFAYISNESMVATKVWKRNPVVTTNYGQQKWFCV